MSNLGIWNPFRRNTALEELRPFARWNPFREMEHVQKRMDEIFRGLAVATEMGEPLAAAAWEPAV